MTEQPRSWAASDTTSSLLGRKLTTTALSLSCKSTAKDCEVQFLCDLSFPLLIVTATCFSATAEDVVSYVSRVLGPYPVLAAEFSEFLPEGVTLFSKTNPALSYRTSRRENVQSSALRFIARIRATDSKLRDPFVVALEQWKQGECGLVEVSLIHLGPVCR